MDPEFEKQLAAKVQQELNGLGELSAPPALAGRVLRAIEQQIAAPWYRCAWQSWPLSLQGVALVALLVVFSGICFGVGELSHVAKISEAGQQAGQWFAWFGVLTRTCAVLVEALASAIRHLGTGILIGCGAALLAAYAACVGLGTACVRLALARR